MQNTHKTHLYALTALLIGFILFPVDKCAAKIQHAFDYRLERIGVLDVTQPITFELEGTPIYPECGTNVTVNIIVSTFNREISRSTEEFDLESDSSFSMSFSVSIANRDTTEVTVEMTCGRFTEKARDFFVTTEDTVEYWKGNPRQFNGPFRSDPLTGRRGRIIPGEFPDLDSIYGIPPDMIHPSYRKQDSTQVRVYEPLPSRAEIDSALIEEQRRRMHEMEETPLTGYGNQLIKIGDTIWIRKYGETKFRVAEQITDLDAHRQAITDSIAAISPETVFNVLYFVEDTAQLTGLHSLVDNLLPTRREGVYRCRISKGLIRMVEERYRLAPAYVDQCPEEWRELFDSEPAPDSGESEPESHLNGVNKGTEIFYSEDFENGWPSLLTAWDALPDYGYDYWGISTLRYPTKSTLRLVGASVSIEL